jgi:hypothetical protein
MLGASYDTLIKKNFIKRRSTFSAVEFEEKDICDFKKLRFDALISLPGNFEVLVT